MKEGVSMKRKSPMATNPHKSPMDIYYDRSLIEGENSPSIEDDPPLTEGMSSSERPLSSAKDSLKDEFYSEPPEKLEKEMTERPVEEER